MKIASWSTRRVAGQVDRSECAVRNCWEQRTREGTDGRSPVPKLQRQFVHLPCLQETDFLRNVGVPQVNGLYGGRSCILAQLVGQSEL
ncbi:hypothetical protein TNCV_2490071 [Trichonephila clavipes]|nr:hypothetical protein TNCV_2490071 [Trichonephila clavipes]